MADPLDYLHSQVPPIIHRDFKPDNILTKSYNGRLIFKIADFGMSRVLKENAYGEFYARSHCGTPIYMAPEALRVKRNKLHMKFMHNTCQMHGFRFFPSLLHMICCKNNHLDIHHHCSRADNVPNMHLYCISISGTPLFDFCGHVVIGLCHIILLQPRSSLHRCSVGSQLGRKD